MNRFRYDIARYVAPLARLAKISTSQNTRNYTLSGALDLAAARDVRCPTHRCCTSAVIRNLSALVADPRPLASLIEATRRHRGCASAGGGADATSCVSADQRAPFHDDLAAGLLVSFLKGSDEIEAGVVDEIELVKMHMKLGTRGDFLERPGQERQRDERCRAVQMQLDAIRGVDALDVEVGQRVDQFGR